MAEIVVSINSFNVETTRVRAKYEFFSATSAFGGLLGLFLGGSVVTVFELSELACRLISSAYLLSGKYFKRGVRSAKVDVI